MSGFILTVLVSACFGVFFWVSSSNPSTPAAPDRNILALQEKLPVVDKVSGMYAADFVQGELDYHVVGVKDSYIELKVHDIEFGVETTVRDYGLDGGVNYGSESRQDDRPPSLYYEGNPDDKTLTNPEIRAKFQRRFDEYMREVYSHYGIANKDFRSAAASTSQK